MGAQRDCASGGSIIAHPSFVEAGFANSCRKFKQMSDHTEAAQLLRSGALYLKRSAARMPGGGLVFFGVKHGGFSVYFDDAPFFHTDLDGRWQRIYQQTPDTHFVKTVDGTVDAIERVREGDNLVLHRRTLAFAETADIDAWVRGRALDLLELLAADDVALQPPPGGQPALALEELRTILQRVASWDAAAWFRAREAFVAAYGREPLGFLSPTCAQPIALRATLRGTADSAIVARSAAEFAAHCASVRSLFGARAATARGLVLAEAKALHQSTSQVAEWLRIAREHFPIVSPEERRSLLRSDPVAIALDGLYAFTTPGMCRSESDWRALRDLGLRHVDILWTSATDALLADIADAKAGELTLGVVIGSVPDYPSNTLPAAAEVASALGRSQLGAGDLIYVIDDGRRAGDLVEIRDQLKAEFKSRGVKVVLYSLEKQA